MRAICGLIPETWSKRSTDERCIDLLNAIADLKIFGTQNTFLLARQMKDYASVGKNLFWQRQIIFAAALILAGYYYSVVLALITAVLVGCSETYDYFIFRKAHFDELFCAQDF